MKKSKQEAVLFTAQTNYMKIVKRLPGRILSEYIKMTENEAPDFVLGYD